MIPRERLRKARSIEELGELTEEQAAFAREWFEQHEQHIEQADEYEARVRRMQFKVDDQRYALECAELLLTEKQHERVSHNDAEMHLTRINTELDRLDRGREEYERMKYDVPTPPSTPDWHEWFQQILPPKPTDSDFLIAYTRVVLVPGHPTWFDHGVKRFQASVQREYDQLQQQQIYYDYMRAEAIEQVLTAYLIPDLARMVVGYVCGA